MNLNKTFLAVVVAGTIVSGCSSSNNMPANDPETPMNPEVPETPENNGIENEDPVTPDPGMLIPSAEAGSDTDRLLKGINRQVAFTILDLNARLSEGSDLSDQQNECLGSYDPAAGQQLLAINCAQSLATGNVPIFVEQASYYDTPDCHAAIFNGDVSNCFLQSARISIGPEFRSSETPTDGTVNGPNGAQLIAAGVEIFYAINSTNLRVENAAMPLTGTFQCDINLLNNGTTASTTGQSCTSTINLAANRFDALLPE